MRVFKTHQTATLELGQLCGHKGIAVDEVHLRLLGSPTSMHPHNERPPCRRIQAPANVQKLREGVLTLLRRFDISDIRT